MRDRRGLASVTGIRSCADSSSTAEGTTVGGEKAQKRRIHVLGHGWYTRTLNAQNFRGTARKYSTIRLYICEAHRFMYIKQNPLPAIQRIEHGSGADNASGAQTVRTCRSQRAM